MTQQFTKLNRKALRDLGYGQKVIEHGIHFERLGNGDGRWAINVMVGGQRVHRSIGRESEGVTLRQVIEILEKMKTEVREERFKLPKGRKLAAGFAESAAQYLTRLEEEGGKDIEKKRQRLKLHISPYFAKTPLNDLNASALEKFKVHRKNQGAKPATINRELAVVSHLLNKAVEWGWIAYKPGQVKKLQEDNTRIVYLTLEECTELLKAAKKDTNPQIYLFILIGLETAMRRSEILTIRIENIRPEQGQLLIPKAKAGARVQPITPRLAKALAQHIQNTGNKSGWLFPSIGNAPSKTGHTTAIEEPFRRVVKAANLDPDMVTIHTLRHTATTHLVQSGIDIPTVQCITGHKTPSMVHRYSHQNGNHIQKAMATLQARYNTAEPVAEITQELHTPPKLAKAKEAETREAIEKNTKREKYPQGNSNPCRLRERETLPS